MQDQKLKQPSHIYKTSHIYQSKFLLGDKVYFEPFEEIEAVVASIEFAENAIYPYVTIRYWLEGQLKEMVFPENHLKSA